MQKIFKIVGWLYRFSYKQEKTGCGHIRRRPGFFIIMSVFPIVMLLLALLRYTPLTADEIVLTFEGLTPVRDHAARAADGGWHLPAVDFTRAVDGACCAMDRGKGYARAIRRAEFHLPGGGDEKLFCDTFPLCLLYSRNDPGACREPWHSCVRLWH